MQFIKNDASNYKTYRVGQGPALFYLNRHLLPVTPHTFSVDNDNHNLVDQLVDGDPVTIAKLDGAQTLKMSFILPIYPDPSFTFYQAHVSVEPKFYRDMLWQIKRDRQPIIFTITYPSGDSVNGQFLLETYSYTQDGKSGSDYQVDITLVEYYPAENQEMSDQIRNNLITHGIRNPRRLD